MLTVLKLVRRQDETAIIRRLHRDLLIVHEINELLHVWMVPHDADAQRHSNIPCECGVIRWIGYADRHDVGSGRISTRAAGQDGCDGIGAKQKETDAQNGAGEKRKRKQAHQCGEPRLGEPVFQCGYHPLQSGQVHISLRLLIYGLDERLLL